MGTVFSHQRDRTHRIETMSLDTYTQNIPLTQKARFWSNYVAALKGSQDLRAPDEAALRTWHPSIIETLPNEFPDLKHEFGKLESQMFDRPRRVGSDPPSPPTLATGSSALGTTTARCTPRSMAPTGPGLRVPRPRASPRLDPRPRTTNEQLFHSNPSSLQPF